MYHEVLCSKKLAMFFWDFVKIFRAGIPCWSDNADVTSSFKVSLTLFEVFYKSYSPNVVKVALAEREFYYFVKVAWPYKEFMIIAF